MYILLIIVIIIYIPSITLIATIDICVVFTLKGLTVTVTIVVLLVPIQSDWFWEQ